VVLWPREASATPASYVYTEDFEDDTIGSNPSESWYIFEALDGDTGTVEVSDYNSGTWTQTVKCADSTDSDRTGARFNLTEDGSTTTSGADVEWFQFDFYPNQTGAPIYLHTDSSSPAVEDRISTIAFESDSSFYYYTDSGESSSQFTYSSTWYTINISHNFTDKEYRIVVSDGESYDSGWVSFRNTSKTAMTLFATSNSDGYSVDYYIDDLLIGSNTELYNDTGDDNSPPFTLDNAPSHLDSTWMHTGYGYTNQTVHPDVVYFLDGWGDVNGSSYKYWLVTDGYKDGYDDYEQPCVLVSNNISNDSWTEPAGNYYDTNPLTGWYWNDGDNNNHFCDSDIVYNDDTDELWCYYLNSSVDTTGNTSLELVKSSDGVNWTDATTLITETSGNIVSPSVVKEGSDWWMWTVNDTRGDYESDETYLALYHSNDGENWSFSHDCGYGFTVDASHKPWHIEVIKYNGTYHGLLVEQNSGADRLCYIESSDRETWTGYDSPILTVDSGSWDSSRMYRSTCVIQDGYMQVLYSARGGDGDDWWLGYTENTSIGGTGDSSNIIIGDIVSLSGLTSGRLTWSGNADETVWCNSTGDGNETLNISISPSGTDILETRVYLSGLNDTDAWINASNITMYASVDNATWREIGTFSDGGSNLTLNDDTWTWADDPFPISSEDYIFCRFKLAIPSGQSADTYYSASSTAWKVYILG